MRVQWQGWLGFEYKPQPPLPHCGAKLNVPESAVGKNGRCNKCNQKFLIQTPKPAAGAIGEGRVEMTPLVEPE